MILINRAKPNFKVKRTLPPIFSTFNVAERGNYKFGRTAVNILNSTRLVSSGFGRSRIGQSLSEYAPRPRNGTQSARRAFVSFLAVRKESGFAR